MGDYFRALFLPCFSLWSGLSRVDRRELKRNWSLGVRDVEEREDDLKGKRGGRNCSAKDSEAGKTQIGMRLSTNGNCGRGVMAVVVSETGPKSEH